jgi:hypothetical protein
LFPETSDVVVFGDGAEGGEMHEGETGGDVDIFVEGEGGFAVEAGDGDEVGCFLSYGDKLVDYEGGDGSGFEF